MCPLNSGINLISMRKLSTRPKALLWNIQIYFFSSLALPAPSPTPYIPTLPWTAFYCDWTLNIFHPLLLCFASFRLLSLLLQEQLCSFFCNPSRISSTNSVCVCFVPYKPPCSNCPLSLTVFGLDIVKFMHFGTAMNPSLSLQWTQNTNTSGLPPSLSA